MNINIIYNEFLFSIQNVPAILQAAVMFQCMNSAKLMPACPNFLKTCSFTEYFYRVLHCVVNKRSTLCFERFDGYS